MTQTSPPNVCDACSPSPGWREVSPSPPDPSRLSLNQKTTNSWSVREAVDDAGYVGPIGVEIFNQDIWNAPGDEVLSLTKERYLQHA
jgi:hypothetical protein